MPVHIGHDRYGHYFKWGHHGHKYYFRTPMGKRRALYLANRQARAIYSSGYNGK